MSSELKVCSYKTEFQVGTHPPCLVVGKASRLAAPETARSSSHHSPISAIVSQGGNGHHSSEKNSPLSRSTN